MSSATLFADADIVDIEALSYIDAATALNVSHASISNWVKTGYLEKHYRRGYITQKSFDKFCNRIVGSEKLNSRANKQHAQTHKHVELTSKILQKVWDNLTDKNYADQLAQLYEKYLSNTHKNKEGVYYTPMAICRNLVQKVELDAKTHFCDPCCGSGNFLIAALEAGVRPENLTGYDIDPVAIEIARRRIFDYTGHKLKNLFVADFLSLAHYEKYDVVITNPPWGKKYSKQEKQKFSKKFGLQYSLDSCSLFTVAIIRSVRDNGKIGMLLPEAFFNVRSFHEIRKLVLNQRVDFLINHEKLFDGLVTKAHSIIFSKKNIDSENKVDCISGATVAKHKQDIFTKRPFSIINFVLDEAGAGVIDAMLNKHHTTLKNKAKWGLGIVTGNNKKHISNTPQEGFIPIFKGSDIQKEVVKQPTHYIQKDFSKYQQVAPLELYKAPCKIIYKFISSDIVFFCDYKQRFVLNSANMIVIDESRLTKTSELVEYFNLDIINWFHKKLFNTHKILRSNLEYIPIYLDYLNNMKRPSNQTLMDYLAIEKVNGTYRVKN